MMQQQPQHHQPIHTKSSQKPEATSQFVKKVINSNYTNVGLGASNIVLPPSQVNKAINPQSMPPQLNPVESSQSLKTSPVKSDAGIRKNYPQSIKKTSTNKAQSLHKKGVSLMGTNLTQQHSNQVQDANQFDLGKNSHQATIINSQKQSQQNSFNDYNSINATNYGEVRGFAKVDNFIVNEKQNTLLTAQQQLQIKNYNKIMQDQQHTVDSLGSTQLGGTRYAVAGSIDMQQIAAQTQGGGFKSFDQRPPMSQLINQNQSQRLSIMSVTGENTGLNPNSDETSQQQQQFNNQQNPAFRSHTNSFKSSNNIAMKYPPNKYVKGGPQGANTSAAVVQLSQTNVKSKKTLQYHHQRTFSDNPNFSNSRGQLFNASAGVPSNQNTNRNFKELIKSVNEKEAHIDNAFINGFVQQNIGMTQSYPLNSVTSTMNMQTQQIQNYNQKMTLGSSRQSAQSQTHIDDREAVLHLIKAGNVNQEKYSAEMKQIYQGVLKDQINKTKQQLKVTQTQFGGPSRKVVQNMKFNNANTQSYRASNGNTLTQGATSKIGGQMNDPKSTPKIFLTKSKQGSKITSQNTSSHGARTSNNATQLQSQLIQKKDINTNFEVSQQSVIMNNITLAGSMIDPKAKSSKGGLQEIQGTSHKRSVSDGNTIFQSLSNRGQIQLDVNSISTAQQIYKQGLKSGSNSNIGLGQVAPEMDAGLYAKQISMPKISQGPYHQAVSNHQKNQNEYQVLTDRHQFKISKTSLYHDNGGLQSIASSQMSSKQGTQQPSISSRQKRDIEMVIVDQDYTLSNQKSQQQKSSLNNSKNDQAKDININNTNSNHNTLKPVDERIETQESAISDPNLSPRTRKVIKLNKKIKLAFQKTNQPPATTSDFYKIGKVMGKGAFGKVNLAMHRLSGKFVALKSINKQFLSEEASKRKVMQEFNILRRTRHRNIVRLYESFETAQHIVFVMEVCGAGDLLTYVRRRRKLKEDVAKQLFKQIIDGLRYCHSRGILHRDIKLDNILLTSEGDIKICDFGVSKLVKNGEIMTEQCGTPAYIAPEIFENKGYEGYASDVWSAGVVLYAMLYGTVPFKASNMTELQKQIIKCQTTFKEEISPESITLLKAILERDPQKRLSIPEILRHPWMQNMVESVPVFTDQEKQKVDSEFAYYNFKHDDQNNGAGEVIHTDPFTEQMLNSTQNSLIKNVSTKSVILAPFNSTRSHIDENVHMHQSIQEMMVDRKFLKFAAKVKEIDRQYEANNNAELDNGVYHQDSEEEKKEEEKKKEAEKNKKSKYNSIETSFDKENKGNNDDDGELQKEIEEGQKLKNQSEWQKLEQMVIDKQKIEDEEEDKNHKSNEKHNVQASNNKQPSTSSLMMMGSAMTLVIDDNIIAEIEKSGFPRHYIVLSLNNDELNYATAFYQLLMTQKEF